MGEGESVQLNPHFTYQLPGKEFAVCVQAHLHSCEMSTLHDELHFTFCYFIPIGKLRKV
jgi:hypothetical protein